jgi:hypothetical protein
MDVKTLVHTLPLPSSGRLQHAKTVGSVHHFAVHDRNRPKFSGPGWLSSKDQVLKGDSGHYPYRKGLKVRYLSVLIGSVIF